MWLFIYQKKLYVYWFISNVSIQFIFESAIQQSHHYTVQLLIIRFLRAVIVILIWKMGNENKLKKNAEYCLGQSIGNRFSQAKLPIGQESWTFNPKHILIHTRNIQRFVLLYLQIIMICYTNKRPISNVCGWWEWDKTNCIWAVNVAHSSSSHVFPSNFLCLWIAYNENIRKTRMERMNAHMCSHWWITAKMQQQQNQHCARLNSKRKLCKQKRKLIFPQQHTQSMVVNSTSPYYQPVTGLLILPIDRCKS